MMQVINKVVLYCRQGFEKECAAEITDKAADLTIYGTAKILEQRGYVVFECYQPGDTDDLIKKMPFRSLIFARQFFAAGNKLTGLLAADRITPILTLLGNKCCYGDVRVESTDTPEGKALAVFCRKFTVPLRKILRENRRLAKIENHRKPVLHLFFESTDSCYVGYSYGDNNSPFYMGIPRLKLPADAPSRSTLKLEEAFYLFIPHEEWQERLAPGMLAVDLGASPGGWTYQLVRRSMMVYAIDNGPMDKTLMMTGQVKHFRENGFKFTPKRFNIHWLVCDMVDRPMKVTELVVKWLVNGWCREAIFNLKLPMKRRYCEVKQRLHYLIEILNEKGINAIIQAKQLYHDREEITIHVQCIWRRHLTKKCSLDRQKE